MSLTISNYNPFHTRSSLYEGFHSFRIAAETTFHDTISKVQDFVTSEIGQAAIGFGLGLGMPLVYAPITERILTAMGFVFSDSAAPDPFMSMGFPLKIIVMPLLTIIAPIAEELLCRGNLQEYLKETSETFYIDHGLSDASAKMTARVSAVFFTSILFGLTHFSNALVFRCNPILFLPQVIVATIMGLILGLAKEATADLAMPIGMHIGNNTLAWANMISSHV